MCLGAKQPSEYSLQNTAEIQAHLSSLQQLQKQHKAIATVPGKHFAICMNSDSDFPKQVPVDFKKFRLV